MTEQRSKVDAVLKSGRQVAMETHWPQGTGESLRSQYSGLEERWRKLWSEGEQWGQLLQTVHPELEKFQVPYTLFSTNNIPYSRKVWRALNWQIGSQ